MRVRNSAVSASRTARLVVDQVVAGRCTSSVNDNRVIVNTPRVNETRRHLAIKLELCNTTRLGTGLTFEYRPNPTFRDIQPRNHLVVGGTLVTVLGEDLTSVAEPRITITTLTTSYHSVTHASQTTNVTDSEPCEVDDSSHGRSMLCRMPALILAADIVEELNRTTEYGLINSTAGRGHGVAVYNTSDGRQRVHIYVGLKLDGFVRYRDISLHHPDLSMQFALDPTVSCHADNLDFNPRKDSIIVIKGRYLTRGSRLVDFRITLGDGECVARSLTDNEVTCRPPTWTPTKFNNDTFCHADSMSLQMLIGNAEYQCLCVRYVTSDRLLLLLLLIVSTSLALALSVIVISTVRCYRRRKSVVANEPDETRQYDTVLDVRQHEYARQLPTLDDDHSESAI